MTGKLGDLSVDAAKLANGAVLTGKLGDLAVEAAKLADSAVTATKIANLAVGTAAISDAAITSAKIEDLAVGTAAIADAAIDSAKIANLAVGTAAIQDLAVSDAKIGSMTAGKITAGDITVTVGVGTGVNLNGADGTVTTANSGYTVTMGAVDVPAESANPLVLFSSDGSTYPFWVDSTGDFSFGGGGLAYSGNEIALKNGAGNIVATIGQEADDSLFNVTQYPGGSDMFSVRYAGPAIDHDIFNIYNSSSNKGVIGFKLGLFNGSNDGATGKTNVGAYLSLSASSFGSISSQYGSRTQVTGAKYNYGSHNRVSATNIAADKDSNIAVYGELTTNGFLGYNHGWAGYFDGGVKITGKSEFTHEGWVDIAPLLINSWQSFNFGYQTPRYRKTPDGSVELDGVITGGTNDKMFTLPVGYRPASSLMLSAISSGETPSRITIDGSGNVYVTGSNSSWLTLTGLRFYAGH